jgi:hypothetical protein
LILRTSAFLALSFALSLLLGGCGASTIRLDIGPSIDAFGGAGFESTISLGLGMPLDYSGRSHHYVQAMGSLGGGIDTRDASGLFITAASLNYIYWAEPSLDVRAGLRFAYRAPGSGRPSLYGFGGHLAILPVVVGDASGWAAAHFCLGPELRIESLWGSPPGDERVLFSLPLAAELTLLAAGD